MQYPFPPSFIYYPSPLQQYPLPNQFPIGTGRCKVKCTGCNSVVSVELGFSHFMCPICGWTLMLPAPIKQVQKQSITIPAPTNHVQKQSITLPALINQVQKQSIALPASIIQLQKQSITLPPQINQVQKQSITQTPVYDIDPNSIQVSCSNCETIVLVPKGSIRFSCTHCSINIDVGVTKKNVQSLPPAHTVPPSKEKEVNEEEVNEVITEAEQEEDGGEVGETFTEYQPYRVSIGPPHPDPIVETSSLFAVQPPEATYKLKIQDDLESSKALSCLQIEAMLYACQRHLQHLPDGSRAGAGVGKGRTIAGLIWENWNHGRRRALWISVSSDLKYDARRDLDDVGAQCIGVHALNKLPYPELGSMSAGIGEGVIFLTYSSLIASSGNGYSRLEQLVQCFGEFDGLIIFDECHKAKNLVPGAGGQPTKTGKAVIDIQVRLPEARVVYCSATGASEPRNLGYMARLGLWGRGTAFINFRDLLVSMEKGGVGALELVAMDMKARGMYVCRTLSFKGAEFEIVEVPLDDKTMDMYGKAAKFWADLRMELMSASEYITHENPNPNQIWRLYWSTHQRFFRQLCASAKVPAVIKLSKQALMEDKCVVIGLQGTGEARTVDAVTKYGIELDDFVSGPRELLLKFVEDNYPLPDNHGLISEETVAELNRKRHSEMLDDALTGRALKVAKLENECKGEMKWEYERIQAKTEDKTESDELFQICGVCNLREDRKNLLQCSSCSQIFHVACLIPPLTVAHGGWSCHSCTEKQKEAAQARRLPQRYQGALRRKLKILELIRSLDLPNNPLDDIIDQLGGPENVAEITGRRGMLVRTAGGKTVIYQKRNTKDIAMDMVNMHEKQAFMEGKKLVAIISEAGSAGVSLQADRRAVNQKRRVHITLELPWSADKATQQFGRTHRSNQVSAPEYRLLFTNLGGERRFASVVAKRLERLGALTQGDRRAGPCLSAYNYDSMYGKKALMRLYRGLLEQEPFPIDPPRCASEESDTIEDFILKGKTAFISVGIIKDSCFGNEKGSKKSSGLIASSDMGNVGRFLNRLLGMPPDTQNRIFEFFVAIFDLLVEKARLEGHLDIGIIYMRAKTVELHERKIVHVDKMSGASTVLFTFMLDRGITWESASALLEEKQNNDEVLSNDGFYVSRREWIGRLHIIFAFKNPASGWYKIHRPTTGESNREMPLRELKAKYRKISGLQRARRDWEDEYETSAKQCMHGPKCKLSSFCTVGRRLQLLNIVGGLVLPIWGTISKALAKQTLPSHKRIRVMRIETTSDNQRLVGLRVPNSAVESVLQDLAWVEKPSNE